MSNKMMTKENSQKRGQWSELWRRLKRNKMAILGLIIILTIVVVACFAGVIADYDTQVIKQNLAEKLQPPSGKHFLGTDEFGRDIFARLIHGARVSLKVGILAVGLSIAIGGTLGALAGYYG